MTSSGIAKGTKTRYFRRISHPAGQRPPNTPKSEHKPKVSAPVESRRREKSVKKTKKVRAVQSTPKRQKSKPKPKYEDKIGDENRLHPNYIPDDPYDQDYEDIDEYYEDPIIDPDPDAEIERQRQRDKLAKEEAKRKRIKEQEARERKLLEEEKKRKRAPSNERKRAPSKEPKRAPPKERKKPAKRFNVNEKRNGKKKWNVRRKPHHRRVAGKNGPTRPVWRAVGDPTRRAFVQKWDTDFKSDHHF